MDHVDGEIVRLLPAADAFARLATAVRAGRPSLELWTTPLFLTAG
ncbi:hypothetical protein [Pseudonocardia sp.]|jgi:hypothetical protein|nr:hypothetical protein [Pseudonocardia sp.]MCW2720733.1 hypothetical protein [Pseudonocardia sp.]MDT7618331.1 hypothetical protein [Pseudonocardiales bacterium]